MIKGTNMPKSDMIKIFDLLEINHTKILYEIKDYTNFISKYNNNNVSLEIFNSDTSIKEFEIFKAY